MTDIWQNDTKMTFGEMTPKNDICQNDTKLTFGKMTLKITFGKMTLNITFGKMTVLNNIWVINAEQNDISHIYILGETTQRKMTLC